MDIREAEKITDTGSLRLDTKGIAPYIVCKDFELPGILHGFSTRLGGVSTGIYESMNLGIRLDDEREHVIENYRRLGESMGFDYRRLSLPDQVHETNILAVTEEDAGDGIMNAGAHHRIDAQITNVRNLPLIAYAADCVPILLADPVAGAVGSVHAGWRGSVSGIAAKTVAAMVSEYGCRPGDIHAVIGPSIGPDSYEVDDPVINAVKECAYIGDTEKDRVFRPVPDNEGKYMLDLWSLNEEILIKAGLPRGNIYKTGLCTLKHHDLFFSHRYTQGRRGLNGSVIMLK